MSCKHPLKGFKIGVNRETGKDILKIVPYNVDHLEKRADGKFYRSFDKDSPTIDTITYRYYVDIPCGRCIGCRLSHSKQWADRAVLELQYHKYNYFITLTYSDDFVPQNKFTDGDGKENVSLSLKPDDLQKFWKRLRKTYNAGGEGKQIRYLACGEYGDQTLRPHYHAIVFSDFEITDLKFYTRTDKGPIFESEFLDSIWQKGKVWIAEANWHTISYVARYVTKKLSGPEAQYYEMFNLVPEFLTCSRKPGIGSAYYNDHKVELLTETKYFFPTGSGSGSASPGRYFFNKFEADFDPEYVKYKKNALKAQFDARKRLKLSNTSQTYIDLLQTEEYNLIARTKSLDRNKL